MKNLREQIEAIPVKDFYLGGYDTITFEAYGDHVYLIHNCPDSATDQEGIKAYFLNHLDRVIRE